MVHNNLTMKTNKISCKHLARSPCLFALKMSDAILKAALPVMAGQPKTKNDIASKKGLLEGLGPIPAAGCLWWSRRGFQPWYHYGARPHERYIQLLLMKHSGSKTVLEVHSAVEALTTRMPSTNALTKTVLANGSSWI